MLLLIVGSIFALQNSWVQTWLAQETAARISKAIGAKVSIRKVHLRIFNRTTLEGFYVEDLHRDTLLYVEYLDADFDNIYLGFSHFDFDHVTVRNGQFNVRQFEGEEDLNIQFILDAINGPRNPNDTVKYDPPKLFFWKLEVQNLNFTYEYRDAIPDTGFGINYDHLRIRDIYGSVNRFMIIDDSLSGELRNMRCHEVTGMEISRMDADFIISYTMMDFANLKIRTPRSEINGKVHFDYDKYKDLSDFVTQVQMRGKLKETTINTNELALFAPELRGLDQQIGMSGNFKGTVEHLVGRNVLLTMGESTRFIGNFSMDGLPDTDSTFFNFYAKEFRITPSDIGSLQQYPFHGGEPIRLPEPLKQLGAVTFRGRLEGYLDDFVSTGLFYTAVGEVETDLAIKYNPEQKQYAYEGKINTPGFDLGKLVTLQPSIGRLALEAQVSGQGFDPAGMNASLKSWVPFIEINGYTCRNISLEGDVLRNVYTARLKVADPNVRMSFSGTADLNTRLSRSDRDRSDSYRINFHALVDRLDLNALRFAKRDSALVVSTELLADFSGRTLDELEGRAELSSSSVQYGDRKFRIDDFLLEADAGQQVRSIRLYSDIANASVSGRFNLTELPHGVARVLNTVLPSRMIIEPGKDRGLNQQFDWSVSVNDASLLSALFFPFLEIGKGTVLNGSLSSANHTLSINGKAPYLKIGGIELSRFSTNATAAGNRLNCRADAGTLLLTDSVGINHVSFVTQAVTDSADMSLNWASRRQLEKADAQLNWKMLFEGSRMLVTALPSLILIEDTLWQVNEENLIVIDTGFVEFDNLAFSHNDEFLRIDGRLSDRDTDELDVIVDNFYLRNINPFIAASGITLDGSARGIFTVADAWGKPFFKSDLSFKRIRINNDLIGDGLLTSKWDPAGERILMDGSVVSGNAPRIRFSGHYIPSRKSDNMDMNITLNNIRVDLLERYMSDIFSSINDGYADGHIHLTGSPDKPVAEGKVQLKRTSVTIGILNTTYSFTTEVTISKNQVAAKNVVLNDTQGNTASLDLRISHTYFSGFYFDIFLRTKRIQALNTREYDNSLFYGTANASGTFHAYGPLDNIVMDISAKTEKGTVFHLPLGNTGELSQQDFITFEKKGTVKKLVARQSRQYRSRGYEVNFNLDITNDAEVVLVFDPKVGDMIRGTGAGNLRLEVSEAGEFNIYGDYVINSGNYLFTLQNVINKPFVLRQGGMISFRGDPYDADINLSAVYRVRTSLYSLVKNIDSSATVKRDIDVDAIMYLSDKLMKPQVRFDIVLPSADENSRNLLKSQINNEDELNRQIFSLIMLRRFWPSQGGVDETAGFSNATELLSSQLSNMLSQLSDDVKLGVNYRQGDSYSGEQFNVLMSTQLLNDRIIIDGNVGTAGMAQGAAQNTTNMVGEFNIEAKVNENGTIRIKVFNRSNQYLLLTNDVPYTQGIGLFYRKEFD